jgi:Carbohydrate phosphorylase
MRYPGAGFAAENNRSGSCRGIGTTPEPVVKSDQEQNVEVLAITRHIGDRWVANLEDELQRLEPLSGDINFQSEWQALKADNKRVLARLIKKQTDVVVDPHSLFDIQVNRLTSTSAPQRPSNSRSKCRLRSPRSARS